MVSNGKITRFWRASPLFIAAAAGIAVYIVSVSVFPYHSFNHDEAVYLQQAAMLLDGQFRMYPPVPEAFRTWFFISDGSSIYPKYSPVPSAFFAVGELIFNARAALAVIAAANILLVYLLVREAFDHSVGVVASLVMAASPLFLINTALFLPYAPTTTLNLLFALGYVRSIREGSRIYALLSGGAVGVAFFSRPYTAVVFASPFLIHAAYTLIQRKDREVTYNLVVTALVGTLFVCVTLVYNYVMTGSPFLFPFEAFSPRDGLGFGERSLLNYTRNYTPWLALEANAHVVSRLFINWVAGGVAGLVLGGVGLAASVLPKDSRGDREVPDRVIRLLFAGVLVAVFVGNIYFWGNLNILGSLQEPGDGFISIMGPYYHYDALLPLSAFIAYGAVWLYRRTETKDARLGLAIAIVLFLSVSGVSGAVFVEKVEKNSEITDVYREAYEPFEERDLGGALVFLPTPSGEWLNHPFQYLRNTPGYDGNAVYALDLGKSNFETVEAFPDRRIYRYNYRGRWRPYSGEKVEPKLERLRVVGGQEVLINTSVVPPENVSIASVRFSSGRDAAYRQINVSGKMVFHWLITTDNASLMKTKTVGVVPYNSMDKLTLEVYFVGNNLDSELYRQELIVRQIGGEVEVLAPPYTEYCGRSLGCVGENALVDSNASISTEVSSVPQDRP